MFVYALKAG